MLNVASLPDDIRQLCRQGKLETPTPGLALGFVQANEVPVFWACGVTTQTAIFQAKPELAITHAPGYMFISDLSDESLTF